MTVTPPDPAPQLALPLRTDHVVGDPDHTPHHNKVSWLINQAVLGGMAIQYPDFYGAVGDGIHDDTAAVTAAHAALPSVGGIIMFGPGRTYKVGNVTFTKPTHLRGMGAKIIGPATGRGLSLQASNSSARYLTGVGPGTGVYNGSSWLAVVGADPSTPLTNIVITDVNVSGVPAYGIVLRNVARFAVRDCQVSNFTYGGIWLNSAYYGVVDACQVSHAVQDPATGLSYGIAVTDSTNTVAARSKHVTVRSCVVSDIPLWEGVDSHGGDDIRFVDNTIFGCHSGITLTVGNGDRTTAPINCLVTGNRVYDCDQAVAFGGSPDDSTVPFAYASGLITANNFTGNTIPFNFPASRNRFFETATDIHGNLGAPDWFFPYAATWSSVSGTDPVQGNGTWVGKYRVSGDRVYFRFDITVGSTTNVGTGPYQVALPLDAKNTRDSFSGFIRDAGGQVTYPITAENGGGSAVTLRTWPAAGSPMTNVTQTNPVALTTGDVITVEGSYTYSQ